MSPSGYMVVNAKTGKRVGGFIPSRESAQIVAARWAKLKGDKYVVRPWKP